MANEDDERSLATYLDALNQVQVTDRLAVQTTAAGQFNPEAIVATITLVFEANRTLRQSHG